MARRPPAFDPELEIDLHGLSAEQALRRLAQGIHTARVRGLTRVRVITGRGWGSTTGRGPVLLPAAKDWLAGPEGQRNGVTSVRSDSAGGALRVRLGEP